MHGESDGNGASNAGTAGGTTPLDIDWLEQRVAQDPGAPEFALLAEAHRRAGRLDDARRIAVAGLAVRPDDGAGRLALGITLLDLGESAAAHYELERAMSSIGGAGLAALPQRDDGATFRDDMGDDIEPEASPAAGTSAVGDDELERAFAGAESVAEEMIDANQIAQAALRADRLDTPEGFSLDSSDTFATETMARLLEEQGDLAGAAAIRDQLADQLGAQLDAPSASDGRPMDAAEVPSVSEPGLGATGGEALGAAARDRARILATLETWLENLRRIPA